MADLGLGWTRVLLAWHHVQSSAPDQWWGFGRVLSEARLDAEVARGVKVAAVVQYTPAWAATDPSHGHQAVPQNLYLPFDHPENYFGNFVYETVKRYAGKIDEWIIWNEPDIRPEDPGVMETQTYTWTGTEADFAQLLRVGYLNVKRANPNARVSFPATSYWADTLLGRSHYYNRILDILANDPTAAANNYYHDAVSVNLYYRADDLYRVFGLFKDMQYRHGIDKSVWLTETNSMPQDDRVIPCWERHATSSPWPTTQEQQGAFAMQAYATAAAAGYERISWWRLMDGNTCRQVGVWGAIRDDSSWRPAAEALRTVGAYFSGFSSAQYLPTERWSRVVFERPGSQRVTVLWNTSSRASEAQLPLAGASVYAVDMRGQLHPVDIGNGVWRVRLAEATARFPGDPPGYHYIGGPPVIVVEDGVS